MRKTLLLALALTLTACPPPPATTEPETDEVANDYEPEDIGTVLATVGDIEIGSLEFQAAASRHMPENGESLTAEERQEILDQLVVEKMLYKEARRRGIDRDPKVQKVMINTLLRQEVYSTVRNSDFSPEELRAYFDTHHDEFVVPERVQIKRIFIRTSDTRTADEARALAEDLHSQVVADPSLFKDIATANSEDPYRRRGGDLGFVSAQGKPGIDQAVVDKAFTMDVGQVSEVFEAGEGFNVIYIANRRERVERTFEQMKGSVLRKVKNERYKELYDGYVDGIRGSYSVSVDDVALGAVEVEHARRLSARPGRFNRPGPHMGQGGGDDGEGTDEGGEPAGAE